MTAVLYSGGWTGLAVHFLISSGSVYQFASVGIQTPLSKFAWLLFGSMMYLYSSTVSLTCLLVLKMTTGVPVLVVAGFWNIGRTPIPFLRPWLSCGLMLTSSHCPDVTIATFLVSRRWPTSPRLAACAGSGDTCSTSARSATF